jgi:hypothetical protein
VFILKNNLEVNGILICSIVYIHLLYHKFHVQIEYFIIKLEKLQSSQKLKKKEKLQKQLNP